MCKLSVSARASTTQSALNLKLYKWLQSITKQSNLSYSSEADSKVVLLTLFAASFFFSGSSG